MFVKKPPPRRRLRSAEDLHLPFRRLAFCLDCEECFAIGHDTCPACGSETWTPLARFLSDRRPAATRQLFIVARQRLNLYRYVKRALQDNPSVEVIIDRRTGQRRETSQPVVPDRRRGDRRLRPEVDDMLRLLGWAIVPREAERQRGKAVR